MMAARTLPHRPGLVTFHTRAYMTVKAKIMKHFFDITCNLCCIFMAAVAAPASGVVHIVVMTLNTTGFLVVRVLKRNGQQGIRWCFTATKLFCGQQRQRRKRNAPGGKRPTGSTTHGSASLIL